MPIKKQHHKKHPKKRDEGKEKEHGQKNEGKEQHDVEGKEDHHHILMWPRQAGQAGQASRP